MSKPVAIAEAMTPGVLNALLRGKNLGPCNDCGFALPVYPGRYPKNCPHCAKPRKAPGAES